MTVGATGGASIIDSFLAVRATEAGASAAQLNTFPDAMVQSVAGSPLRAVRYMNSKLGSIPIAVNTDQLAFVQKYRDDMLVATSIGLPSTLNSHGILRPLLGRSNWMHSWRCRSSSEAGAPASFR